MAKTMPPLDGSFTTRHVLPSPPALHDVSTFQAFVQSLASENVAHLISMQAAEKNILELEEKLLASFRKQRQTGITNELFDIISGFEALSEEDFKI